MTTLLILGSGPNVLAARGWPRAGFDAILAINNAWQVRPDWDYLIHPEDFPPARRPGPIAPHQQIITAEAYVRAQNAHGGFVYAGGTMAFTASYWALYALRPKTIAYLGCDMVYPNNTATHFYGAGTADPLRKDITLRNLSAKSARLLATATAQGCALVNLSTTASRQVFPRATLADLAQPVAPPTLNQSAIQAAQTREAELGYMVASGRYWLEQDRFDRAEIDRLDALWLNTLPAALKPGRVSETVAQGRPRAARRYG